MSNTEIRITRLPHAADLPLPENSHRLDLVTAVLAGKPVVIAPGERAAIPTGLVFTLPRGVNAQIWPRTGLAFQYGITVLNGLLDPITAARSTSFSRILATSRSESSAVRPLRSSSRGKWPRRRAT